jgi:hypothetical protein
LASASPSYLARYESYLESRRVNTPSSFTRSASSSNNHSKKHDFHADSAMVRSLEEFAPKIKVMMDTIVDDDFIQKMGLSQ